MNKRQGRFRRNRAKQILKNLGIEMQELEREDWQDREQEKV